MKYQTSGKGPLPYYLNQEWILFLLSRGGSNGDGVGGGLYVTSGGVVTLKKSTVALNFASTSNDDISGTVTYL